jgi:imidazolonepropionase-like amidohydrolase
VLARFQRVVDTFSQAKFHDLAARFVAAGTWQVPTLIRDRTMQIGDDARYRNDPNLRYVPKHVKQTWEDVSQQFETAISPEGRRTLRNLFALQTQLVKPFIDAGAPMMAGSDGGGSGGFCVAGFSLHEEFDLLGAAGLTPLEVLQMTTLNGARFLGRNATMGTVAVGKNADLVLLDANPVARVANLHAIFAVVRAGKYYSAVDLAALKERTAERVASGAVAMVPMRPSCC